MPRPVTPERLRIVETFRWIHLLRKDGELRRLRPDALPTFERQLAEEQARQRAARKPKRPTGERDAA